MSNRPIITLLTDFGHTDYFVAAVKGVILDLNPEVQIVDVTHDIDPQDIESAAFTLLGTVPSFPAGTIHVAVVDPGVGSPRRAIVVSLGGQFLIGPDNGIFSYVCEAAERQRKTISVIELTNAAYFRESVSGTFHGRDVFAPVAAAVSRGAHIEELGEPITDMVRLQPLAASVDDDGTIRGRILHIDRFGNCITNITRGELSGELIFRGATIAINGKTIRAFRKYFSEPTDNEEKVFALWGSAEFLEIATQNNSAARILNAKRGDKVVVATPRANLQNPER